MIYFLFAALITLTLLSPRFIVTKTIITCVALLLFAFWYVCNMFTGHGVTDAVFYHLFETSTGASTEDLVPKIKVAAFYIILLILLVTYCTLVLLGKIKSLSFRFTGGMYVICLSLILSSAFAKNIYLSVKNSFLTKGDSSLVEKEYANILNEKKASKKYNYVFIYAESLERTFRDLRGKNHLPKLSQIADKYIEFTNIIQPAASGFGWTMAGMVNTQCGIPLVMAQGNSGANFAEFLSNAKCVASWFNESGYKTEFIRGSDKNFAGGNKFFSQHGWQRQDDLGYFKETGQATLSNVSGWGIHDDAMLDHAWNEFQRLSSLNTPFLLSFLTVNTHAPDGFFLPVCNEMVNHSNKYAILSAVECSDYLLSGFINKIVNSEHFDNTIIVLVSDHLMMANDASSLLNEVESKRRNNFIVIKKDIKPAKVVKEGTLVDVWPTVFDISGDKKSVGFGRSLLDNDSDNFAKAIAKGDISDYLSFSSELWGIVSLSNGLSKVGDFIQIGKQQYKLPVYGMLDGNIIHSLWFEGFAKNIVNIAKSEAPFFYANICKNIGIDDDTICAYIVTKDDITKMRISPNGIVSRKKFDKSTLFYRDNILGVSSAPFYMDTGFSDGAVDNLPSGINFYTIEHGKLNLNASYQTCIHQQVDSETVQNILKKNKPLIVASSDSVYCGEKESYSTLSQVLSTGTFDKLQFRQQTIGVYNAGKSSSLLGLPLLPLDGFIDLQKGKIFSVCQAFDDCVTH